MFTKKEGLNSTTPLNRKQWSIAASALTLLIGVSLTMESKADILEKTKDACGRAYVLVKDYSNNPATWKSIPKPQGFRIFFKPQHRKFPWYCSTVTAGGIGESSKEWATCQAGTNRVAITRKTNGAITWYCYDD